MQIKRIVFGTAVTLLAFTQANAENYTNDGIAINSVSETEAETSWINDVTFKCVAEDGNIYVAPRRLKGLLPVFDPVDAATWSNVTWTLSNAGSDRSNLIASLYTVNYWNPSRIKFPELQGYREGECLLTVTVKNPKNSVEVFTKEFKVIVTEDKLGLDNFEDGTIILNEEWYGHTNGSLNYITEDNEIFYQVYSRINNSQSFGATSQHGSIWGKYLLVASKQAQDGGDPLPGGGRFVIAEAKTLKRLGSIDLLSWNGVSGDGRAVVGATENKAYVSANNGIYVIDITDPTAPAVIGKIGSDNNADLYNGQVGDMVNAGKYVFAVKQSTGLLIIDTETDQVVKTIEDANVQGVTQTADGRVWYVTSEDGCNKFVALDQYTLETVFTKTLSSDYGTIVCSWGAWRSTAFRGNYGDNRILFVSGAASIMGGANGPYYTYNPDTDEIKELFKMENLSGVTEFDESVTLMTYGTPQIDPRYNRVIAMAGRKGAASGGYRDHWILFADADNGEITHNMKLEPYYWFQSLPILPDKYDAEFNFDDVELTLEGSDLVINLDEVVSDRDNISRNILFSLEETPAVRSGNEVAEVSLNDRTLTISPKGIGNDSFTINAISNGRKVSKKVNVSVNVNTGVEIAAAADSMQMEGNRLYISGMEGTLFTIYNINGTILTQFTADSDNCVFDFGTANGMYIVRGNNGSMIKCIVR